MTACCGLDCCKCDAYLATQENSDGRRASTAQKWSELFKTQIKPEQINCDGCKSTGRKFHHCKECEIRQCCLKKNMENCATCQDYPCDILSQFINWAPEAGLALQKLRSQN